MGYQSAMVRDCGARRQWRIQSRRVLQKAIPLNHGSILAHASEVGTSDRKDARYEAQIWLAEEYQCRNWHRNRCRYWRGRDVLIRPGAGKATSRTSSV